jgi:glycolate oxidase FAD binding subunit
MTDATAGGPSAPLTSRGYLDNKDEPELRPQTEAEVAEIVRAGTPVRIRGGGTRPVGRPVAATPMDVSGLSGITRYEPGALTLVARAGTPLVEIEAVLAAERQRLPFEPGDLRGLLGTAGTPTIGGVVAANVSGPRRVQAGACRDSLIGVRFVDGTGAVVSNGGRTMKNVTGYDLVKLMAGSWGTLGVLTEVSFKVLPAPGTEMTLLVDVPDATAAVAALTSALTSPFDVTAAAWMPGTGAMVRIEGFAQSVAYRTGELERRLAPFGAVRRDDDPALWRKVRDVTPFRGRAGDVWRLSVKPSDAPDIAARLGGEVMLDWGGGLIWALLPEGTDARARIGGFSGHATLMRASDAVRSRIAPFQPGAPAVAALTLELRARFDPKGLLNPGLMD